MELLYRIDFRDWTVESYKGYIKDGMAYYESEEGKIKSERSSFGFYDSQEDANQAIVRSLAISNKNLQSQIEENKRKIQAIKDGQAIQNNSEASQ